VDDGALPIVCQWLQTKENNFYQAGTHALVQRWKKAADKSGNYADE
jgi:hypothetical protein